MLVILVAADRDLLPPARQDCADQGRLRRLFRLDHGGDDRQRDDLFGESRRAGQHRRGEHPDRDRPPRRTRDRRRRVTIPIQKNVGYDLCWIWAYLGIYLEAHRFGAVRPRLCGQLQHGAARDDRPDPVDRVCRREAVPLRLKGIRKNAG
ncbi:MAG: hypothetical protein MZU97_06560 [Bacillus subtilis]|nr:hypothetical protein [Bacillus subtilis]